MAYFKFVEDSPEFFKKNLHELFEVDDLHQKLYELYEGRFVDFSRQITL